MTAAAAAASAWPPHAGEVAALLRADPRTVGWSRLLRATVGLMLPADVQIVLFWGPDYVAYYNDTYAPTIGNKHPRALGRPAIESWRELWDDLEPLLARVRTTGETVSARDRPFRIERRGYLEDVHFDISYSAVLDDAGGVAGVLCLVNETTDRVRATRERAESDAALRVAEVALRAEAERIQLALNAGAVMGTWLWDVPADRVTGDAPFARTFGIDPPALQAGVSIAVMKRAIHPDDLPGVEARIAEALAQGGRYRAQYRVPDPQGGWKWIEANGHVELDDSGQAVRFPGVVIDASDRRLAAETRDQFRLAQAAAGLGVFSLELATGTLTVSPEFCELFGLPVTDTLPAARVEALHWPAEGSAMSTADGRLTGDSALETEYRVRRADTGAAVWLARRAEYVRDPQGRITAMRGVVHDITRLKAATAALQAHREDLARMNASLEARVQQRTRELDRIWRLATDLMLVARLDGTIEAVNPAWQARLGWAEHDVIGHAYPDFVHPDDLAGSQHESDRLADGVAVQKFENRWRHRDGTWRVISWTAVPEAGFVHAVGRDVTDERAAAAALREAEARLRQSQKMEAVGQLTGGIAHDFNNLLQGISGSLEVVRRRLAQDRPEDATRHVASALGATQRAAALTHRLLAFSRRQPLDPKPVRANPLVGSMEDLLRRTLGEHIALELVLAGGLWTTLCDPNQLENALLNLAINARDAMPDGGTLRIETCNTRLPADAHGAVREGVCIAVVDTGSGMAPDVRDRAFEPFFTTKPLGQGTGLGLSMVYGFALQSEGACRIESAPGRGTRVELLLPRHAAADAAEAEPLPAAPTPGPEGASVLLVEDDAIVRELLADMLGELGCRVATAADGPAGLAALERGERVDLLLTDIGLPGLSGRQLADAARRLRPELRVLLMTGYAESAALADGILAPGMSMITKPFTLDALVARVREALAGPAAP